MKTIDHINISVTNIKESIDFFTNLLAFTLEEEGLLEGEWFEKVTALSSAKAYFAKLSLQNNKTKIELLQYIEPQSDKEYNIAKANQLGFRHLAFEVDNIELSYKNLKTKGVHFLSDIQERKQKKICYFLGPDNILLELAEYN
jgi:catechol 2,3-dioxygenase-like lactoylglutathione lyase family enzyme